MQEPILPENNSNYNVQQNGMHAESSILCGGGWDDESGPIKDGGYPGVSSVPEAGFSYGGDIYGCDEPSEAFKKERAKKQRSLANQRRRRQANPEKTSAEYAKWIDKQKLEDPEFQSKRMKKWRDQLPQSRKDEISDADAIRLKIRYHENKDEHLANCKAYYEKNKVKAFAQSKQWCKENPEIRKLVVDNHNRKKRGMPLPLWPEPAACELCEKPETRKHHKTGRVSGLSLDHCHETGVFRGWLCFNCNSTLGKVRDSSDLLLKMAAYIDCHKTQ